MAPASMPCDNHCCVRDDTAQVTTVAVLRWPEEGDQRVALRDDGLPRLLIVSTGSLPPQDLDLLEDWVFASSSADEIEFRIATLEARATQDAQSSPSIDDDGVHRYGGRWIALGPIEARLARELTGHVGELVPRPALEAVAWEGKPVRTNTADRQFHRLRGHLAAVGLVLVTVRGKGYILEALLDRVT